MYVRSMGVVMKYVLVLVSKGTMSTCDSSTMFYGVYVM